jgi:hypothetical protein
MSEESVEREDRTSPDEPAEESEDLESGPAEADKGATGDEVAAPFFERTD